MRLDVFFLNEGLLFSNKTPKTGQNVTYYVHFCLHTPSSDYLESRVMIARFDSECETFFTRRKSISVESRKSPPPLLLTLPALLVSSINSSNNNVIIIIAVSPKHTMCDFQHLDFPFMWPNFELRKIKGMFRAY